MNQWFKLSSPRPDFPEAYAFVTQFYRLRYWPESSDYMKLPSFQQHVIALAQHVAGLVAMLPKE